MERELSSRDGSREGGLRVEDAPAAAAGGPRGPKDSLADRIRTLGGSYFHGADSVPQWLVAGLEQVCDGKRTPALRRYLKPWMLGDRAVPPRDDPLQQPYLQRPFSWRLDRAWDIVPRCRYNPTVLNLPPTWLFAIIPNSEHHSPIISPQTRPVLRPPLPPRATSAKPPPWHSCTFSSPPA